MKVKLLKKVRKQYQIYYFMAFKSFRLVTPRNFDGWHDTMNEANKSLISQLRDDYPNLGYYNRQRAIKKTGHKVWYK